MRFVEGEGVELTGLNGFCFCGVTFRKAEVSRTLSRSREVRWVKGSWIPIRPETLIER